MIWYRRHRRPDRGRLLMVLGGGGRTVGGGWLGGVDRQLTSGLSSGEAAARLVRFGANAVAPPRPTPWWRRVLTQLRDPLIVVLLAAGLLTVVTGDLTDAAVILLVVVVNTSVGVVQEVRADQAVAALRELSAPMARVVRDGQERELSAEEVVPGDLVVLAEGDVVPADAQVVEAAALLVDESALTGESVAVDKAAVDAGEELGEVVSAGTVVVRGRGRAVVTATGADSAMGRIAALLGATVGLTPLQRRLVGLGRVLAGVAVALCAVVLVLGLLRGQPLELMVVTAISLVVAAVPESLPAVVTLSLALGARRMAARHAIVRRLPAVETLGSVTVLATDKTGTLTEGRMVAQRLWTPSGEATVTGSGYGPHGEVVRDGRPVTADRDPDLIELLGAVVLCNDATLRPPDRDGADWAGLGDPTEAALLAAGAKLGLERSALEQAMPRVAELPFDSAHRRMTTVHRLAGGGFRVLCKGAPEVLVRSEVLGDDADTLAAAASQANDLARGGYRTLAVAAADQAARPDPARLEVALSLLGLVAIADPPRAAAASTIRACQAAGITPVLITGDHPATARATAERLGIIDPADEVVVGPQLGGDAVPAPARVRVFARTTPEQKLNIVQAWRDNGAVVAMTGDGVNDGPALRRADIGVAMGRRGTEVARQAADLVLADDDLATLVAAVEEGRRVYANVRRFLLYGLSGGAAEILVMLAGPFLGLPLPLLPAQILWINLLTHGLAGVALGAEPAAPDIMRQPPRPPTQSVLGGGLWPRILRIGLAITAVTLGIGVWAQASGRAWQSMVYLALGLAQLGVALGVRARPGITANPFLLAAVAAALVLQVAGLYLPPLRELLGTVALPPADLAVAMVAAAVGYLAVRLDRWLHRPHPPSGPGAT
jgi:P-type Ca2+ transporter type 2C